VCFLVGDFWLTLQIQSPTAGVFKNGFARPGISPRQYVNGGSGRLA
jgi:hypothetical protein